MAGPVARARRRRRPSRRYACRDHRCSPLASGCGPLGNEGAERPAGRSVHRAGAPTACPEEVAVDGVGDVGPVPPWSAGWRGRRPGPLGGLPLGDGDGLAGVEPRVEPPRRLHRVTRMASMSMAASAARSMVPWKLESGLPNCSRSFRCAAVWRRAASQIPLGGRTAGGATPTTHSSASAHLAPTRRRARHNVLVELQMGWISRLVVTVRSPRRPRRGGRPPPG